MERAAERTGRSAGRNAGRRMGSLVGFQRWCLWSWLVLADAYYCQAHYTDSLDCASSDNPSSCPLPPLLAFLSSRSQDGLYSRRARHLNTRNSLLDFKDARHKVRRITAQPRLLYGCMPGCALPAYVCSRRRRGGGGEASLGSWTITTAITRSLRGPFRIPHSVFLLPRFRFALPNRCERGAISFFFYS